MYDPTKRYIPEIERIIKTTWNTRYVRIVDGIMIKNFTAPDAIPHVDGIGTKGVAHWIHGTYTEAAFDALAQNLNDIPHSIPYALSVGLSLPVDDHPAILEFTDALATMCREYDIAYTSGDTAIKDTTDQIEAVVQVLHFMPFLRDKEVVLEEGDVLIGIASDGFHASGFSLLRSQLGVQGDRDFVSDITRPTRIYWNVVQELNRLIGIHGPMHISGGAFTRLHRVLGRRLDAVIHRNHSLNPQNIFQDLYATGVSDRQMYEMVNCGIGYIVGASRNCGGNALEIIRYHAMPAAIIGEVVKGSGRITIESKFSRATVVYE